jgi:HD-like signal output (HDOD) protein
MTDPLNQRLHLLFVDDEPNVLQGLRRMMHSLRDQWEVGFATSGEEGLDYMNRHPVDLVVSDLRMPNMNGVEFLTEVSKRYPDTIRFVLSGHAEQELILRSVGPAHQLLAKPCQKEDLVQSVSKALSLRQHLRCTENGRLMLNDTNLPVRPKVYQKLVQSLQNPNAELEEVASVVGEDPIMSIKILKMVNSSLFGLRSRIDNIKQAISLLGMEAVSGLTLTAGVFSEFSKTVKQEFHIDGLYDQATAIGAIASKLAGQLGGDRKACEEAMIAGLTHDFGTLLFIKNSFPQYRQLVKEAAGDIHRQNELETSTFGFDHAQVGAYMLGQWGMSDDIVEAVAYHHAPSTCHHREMSTLFAVHIADAYCKASRIDPSKGKNCLDHDYVYTLISEANLDALIAGIQPDQATE